MCLAIVVLWGDVRQRFDLLIVDPSVAWLFVDYTLQLSCCPGNSERRKRLGYCLGSYVPLVFVQKHGRILNSSGSRFLFKTLTGDTLPFCFDRLYSK